MFNLIIVHGYLGRDPELKDYTDKDGNKKQLVRLSIGCSRDMGDETDWFDAVMWGKRAQVVDKFFSKGSQILLWGRMESNVVDKDGIKTKYWKINGNGFDFCDSKDSPRGSSNNATQGEPVEDAPDSWEEQEGDIPF